MAWTLRSRTENSRSSFISHTTHNQIANSGKFTFGNSLPSKIICWLPSSAFEVLSLIHQPQTLLSKIKVLWHTSLPQNANLS